MDLVAADPPGWQQAVASSQPLGQEQLEQVMQGLPEVAAAPAVHMEVCTICLEVPGAGEPLTTLPCCHWYHRDCIREWLAHSTLCPLCKATVLFDEGGAVAAVAAASARAGAGR